ncbi:response regulator [Marinibactrum halimedae]|nr:response regulator transcription factor [Marinibactrum halimedae]MCD9459439.1 response regulator transcription factor [Marinibactrum halimedae]
MRRSEQDIIRIVLADDHLVVRQGLIAILELESDLKVVGEASDGHYACALYEELNPDVMILDLRMPQMDGFETVQQLIRMDSSARILIMTTYDSDEDIWRCLKAGAKGYLLKDATHAEIVSAVRAVAKGEQYTSPGLTEKIVRRVATPELTRREREVIHFLATGKTNKEIARLLNIEEGTVKTHLKSIFSKLSTSTRTETITKARERGLLRDSY